MSPDELSLSEARRIAMPAQGFDRPRPGGRVDVRQLDRAIRRLGFPQNVVGHVGRIDALHAIPLHFSHSRSIIPVSKSRRLFLQVGGSAPWRAAPDRPDDDSSLRVQPSHDDAPDRAGRIGEIRQQRAVQPHLDLAVREDLRRPLHQHGRARDHRGPVRPAGLGAAAGRARAGRGQRHRRRRVPPGEGLRSEGHRDRPGRGDGRHRPRAGQGARADRLGLLHPGRRARDRFPRSVRHHLEPGRVHAHPGQAAALRAAVFADGARRPAGDHRLRPGQEAGLARVRALHREDRLQRHRAAAIRQAARGRRVRERRGG